MSLGPSAQSETQEHPQPLGHPLRPGEGTVMLRGWSGVCVSHGNLEKQRGAGGITDFHLSAWAARAALGWTRLLP